MGQVVVAFVHGVQTIHEDENVRSLIEQEVKMKYWDWYHELCDVLYRDDIRLESGEYSDMIGFVAACTRPENGEEPIDRTADYETFYNHHRHNSRTSKYWGKVWENVSPGVKAILQPRLGLYLTFVERA